MEFECPHCGGYHEPRWWYDRRVCWECYWLIILNEEAVYERRQRSEPIPIEYSGESIGQLLARRSASLRGSQLSLVRSSV